MPCSSTIFKRSQQRRHTYTCAVSPEQSEVDDPVVQLRPSPSRTCETKYEIAEVKWNKRLDRLHRQQMTRLESVRSPQLTWTQQLQSGSLRLSSDWLRVKHLSVYISRPCQSCCRTEECKKSPHTSGSVCASETQFVRLKAWNTRSSEACQGYFTVSRILSVLTSKHWSQQYAATDELTTETHRAFRKEQRRCENVCPLLHCCVFSSLIQLKCCGFTNYSDFVGSEFEKENGGVLPPSCCRTNSAPCSPAEAERSSVKVRHRR